MSNFTKHKLSQTEIQLGGIPSSPAVIDAHANAIEQYIQENVGKLDEEGTMGNMYFNRTLEDWSKYDINNRTRFDATVSSGFAIMATQKQKFKPTVKLQREPLQINLGRYDNSGNSSRLIKNKYGK